MSNADKPRVIATRWWWVRHAPVREDGGCIYGQKDLGCDTSDRVVFEAVGKILPRNAVWYASNLKRTHQTAHAIWAAGFPKPSEMPHVNAFSEQHLGEWQGLNRAAFLASRPIGTTDQRSASLTPLQALYFMNGPFPQRTAAADPAGGSGSAPGRGRRRRWRRPAASHRSRRGCPRKRRLRQGDGGPVPAGRPLPSSGDDVSS